MARGSGKHRGSGRGSGKHRSRRKSGRRSGRRRASAGGASLESIRVICRECYAEWNLNVKQCEDEPVVCPDCGHASRPPTEDQLHQIALYKGPEEKNLLFSLISLGVAFLSFLVWILGPGNPADASEGAMFWLPIGVAFIAIAATVAFGAKYETSRYDTYL